MFPDDWKACLGLTGLAFDIADPVLVAIVGGAGVAAIGLVGFAVKGGFGER